MKGKIFVWHPSLPGNLQSVAPLMSCAVLMSSVGQKKGMGIPEAAFWACSLAASTGSYSTWWGFAGSERLSPGSLHGGCSVGLGQVGSRVVPAAGTGGSEGGQMATTALLPTCRRLKSSLKSQTTLQDAFQCICHRHCSHHQGNQVARI